MNARVKDLYGHVSVYATADREHEAAVELLLLVMMADGTSGHGSYAAGRYLDVAAPDAQGQTLLDFNRSYNPPCAFSIYATCPLPPAENRLDLRIEAGEKAYAHKPVAGQEV